MTRNHQLRFEIPDLLAVRLTCEECNVSLSYPMDAFGATSAAVRLQFDLPDKGD